jgi:hypothetical protein
MNRVKEHTKSVGINLRKMRTDLGHSRKAMSVLLGYDKKHTSKLSDYENGKACAPLHLIIKAMEVTEIPMEDLYDVMFDPNYKLPKRYKPYANATDDYERFYSDRRIQQGA